MSARKCISPRLVLSTLCASAALLLLVPVASGQSVADQAKSLALVPEDAGSYAAMFHNKDVFDAVAGSKAYARFSEMESVGPLLTMAKMQYGELTKNPLLKGPLEVLLDGLSQEVFFYVDPTYIRLMQIQQESQLQGTMAMWASLLQGDPAAVDNMAQLRATFDTLNAHIDELVMPELVIGMRVKDAEAAKGLLPLVEAAVKPQLEKAPPEFKMPERLQRETVGGVDLLTLKLDGAMVPWEEVPWDQFGEPGKYDGLVAKLKTLTVAVSMGVKDDFLILSYAPDNQHFAEMGTAKPLSGRPEMAKLAAAEGKKLRGLTYVSADAVKASQQSAMAPIQAMVAAVPQMLPDDIDDMLRRQIEADAAEFSKDLQAEFPEPGAMLNVTTFSQRGFDSMTYNWSENPLLDGSQPLSLLNHVGGDPIAYYVGRGKSDPQDYDNLVKWLKKFDGYFTKILEMQEPPEEVDRYRKFRAEIDPLLARLDKANREMLQPALQDGQSGIVLDAKLTSTQWAAAMPESPHPLPMLEIGMLWGVSDAGLLKKGCQEYFAVVSEMLTKLHEVAPDEMPDVKLPPPEERDFDGDTIYYYLLPKDWGIDKRIAPNGGMSQTVAALSLTPLHTKRLLKATPPATAGPVAMHKDKPLATAGSFNFAQLVDAVTPWVEYGVSSGPPLNIQVEPAEDPQAAILEQVRTGAEILKCFRGYSSVTYTEGDVQVTHGEWHFEDLK